jgi:hypothetical protein
VEPTMTGRELANLAKVPADNASITRKNSDVQIGLDEPVHLKNGDHFEIIRDRVLAGASENSNKGKEKIHIFINNIKFDENDGVEPTMTGRELANLAKVPADNASITRKNSDVQIGLDDPVHLKNGDHFEIIRDRVLAGASENSNKGKEKIHIFINNIKFDENDGVKPTMTGRELANLATVPADNASITRKNSDVQIGLEEPVNLKNGDHFEIIRDSVLAGFTESVEVKPAHVLRIQKELEKLLLNSGINAKYIKTAQGEFVRYYGIDTDGKRLNLPGKTDVLVKVPDGYPTALIDMPAVPKESKLFKHVVGSTNPQETVTVDDETWTFVSYHPYNSGQGGLDWNPSQHGFHHYAIELFMWLHKLV